MPAPADAELELDNKD